MKKTLYKHRFLFVICLILATFFTVVTSITVNYTVTAPGYNDNINEFIVIEDGIEETGSFSTTSVIVLYKMPLLAKWYSDHIQTVSVRESPQYYSSTTSKALNYRSMVMKDDSLAKSVIVAYEEAGIDIDYTESHLVSLVFDYLEEDSLQLGDEIISLNGYSADSFPQTSCHDIVDIKLMRDGEEKNLSVEVKEIDGQCSIGFSISSRISIESSQQDYHFIESNTGGPSGGLMQSLYIWNELTEKDYTYGLDIAGTGTISLDGSVGQIGGIKEKIITSSLNGIDVFFCPMGKNCEDAKEVLSQLSSKMKLVPVSTFDQAIAYLESYGDTLE